MGSPLLLAMSVLSQFAGLAMSTKGAREIRLVLSVRPDTNVSKVRLVCFPFLDSGILFLLLNFSYNTTDE